LHGLLGAGREAEDIMREVVIVGGGYAGFSTAWGLEKLRPGEARVTLIDPAPT